MLTTINLRYRRRGSKAVIQWIANLCRLVWDQASVNVAMTRTSIATLAGD